VLPEGTLGAAEVRKFCVAAGVGDRFGVATGRPLGHNPGYAPLPPASTGRSKRLSAQLTSGNHALGKWSYVPALDRHLFTRDEPTNAGDVWVMAAGQSMAKVSSVFDSLATEFRTPRQGRIEWQGADGTTVEGLLFYPLDYQSGQRYPLVVQSHGGPQSSDKFGFGRWSNYTQVLTAKGYAVLQTNYRGSTGYGDAFLRDMVGNYFKNAHLDVMAGVDRVIAMGVADGDRLAKMGWSGGGHMTNKLITFTNRFKAFRGPAMRRLPNHRTVPIPTYSRT
jgi:dipeptidyl aminopeptidase/acylaminoacyl peptidase